MKALLLRKIRKQNPIYQRNGLFRYVCEVECSGNVWWHDSGWQKEVAPLLEKRRENILYWAKRTYGRPFKKRIL